MISLRFPALLALSLSVFCLCTPKSQGGSDGPEVVDNSKVVSKEATDISSSGATLNAEIDGFGETPRELGFEWGYDENLREVLQSQDILPDGKGSFSATLEGLNDGSKVFFRAYAMILKDGKAVYT